MANVTKLDNALYNALYNTSKYDYLKFGDPAALWQEIKDDKEVLKEAVSLIIDKWGQVKVKGEAIAEQILLDYEKIDKEIYATLIKNIYTYPTVARIALGRSNGNYSFLLISLYNPNLELDAEQKAYVIKEAMNKESYYIHGSGAFDIRYWILRNASFKMDEKQSLMEMFWTEDEYNENLNTWEWQIVNESNGLLNIDSIYDYTHEDILKLIKNEKYAHILWEDISFCRLVHKLRPANYEIKPKLTLKN